MTRNESVATTRTAPSSREAMLDAAFDEMYMHGFRAAGIELILATSGASKGSLYHHFGNKRGLGYAVIEERVRPLVRERYLRPFEDSGDPIDGLLRMGERMEEELLKTGILARGCPLNNLVQEMSGVDDGFRERLASVLELWRSTIAQGLRQGQAAGTVSIEADPVEAGTFIVATLMGAVGFAKNALDVAPFGHCRKALEAYVATLRPGALHPE